MFGSQKINEENTLEIGGISVTDLREKYQTPLYVMDKKYIVDKVNLMKNNFKSDKIKTEIAYASKAFLTVGMCKLVKELDISLDVVSGGELYTASKSGIDMKRVHFHGNSKSVKEIEMALDLEIGTVIVDNHLEFETLERICGEKNKKIDVILRVNPGIDAHTHEYIQTTLHDSKFGESIFMKETMELIKKMDKSDYIVFKGLHSHIGSQISDHKSFLKAAEVMSDYIKEILDEGIVVEVLNLGGGFGIFYAEGDVEVDLALCLSSMVKIVEEINERKGLGIKEIQIEPGRSLVANAGTTLYTVQGLKKTYTGKNYYFIDGGMTDNIRPALYQATYTGTIGNKMLDKKSEIATIAGTCCESGDLLIKDAPMQKACIGDVLCIFGTGAYNYSMSSNYNRNLKPAVIMVEDGKAELIVKRETYEDLIRNDVY